MPYDYSSILSAQAERIAADQASAVRDLEVARLADDPDGTMYAAGRILELDAQRAALNERANTFVSQQQQHQERGNRYGLSENEVEHAVASTSHGSKEERIQSYAYNKQRLGAMRLRGEYPTASQERNNGNR